MKKIIIVGHSQQKCEKIAEVFQHFGMKSALPSRREGLTPIEIGALLKKVMRDSAPVVKSVPAKVPARRQLNKRREKKKLHTLLPSHQVEQGGPHSMWDYIPMDLMLANIDQEFWGWADSEAIDLLEYWKTLDPNILFVLSYEQPQAALLELSSETQDALDMSAVHCQLKRWEEYNTKILNFFHQNQDCAVLVNGHRIRSYAESSIQVIYDKFVPDSALTLPQTNAFQQTSDSDEQSAILKLITDHLLHQSPSVQELYAQLQATANLPFVTDGDASSLHLALSAWNERYRKNKQLQQHGEQLEQIQQDLEEQQAQNALLRQTTKELESQQLSQEEEKTHILSQLHLTQEELEKLYHQLASTKQSFAQLENAQKTLVQTHKALEAESKSLSEQLNQQEKTSASVLAEVQQENHLLLSQLHLVQEEFEKLHLAHQLLKEKPPILGAADRIKNQLRYRIGATLIHNSASLWGWLTMPFSLVGAYRDYKREHKKNQGKKLPKIEHYQDALEAEKVKKHLSYQLGGVFLQNIKNPLKWLVLPFSLYSVVKNHKKN